MIKHYLHRLPFPLLTAIYHLHYRLTYGSRAELAISRAGLPRFERLALGSIKSSDTLFILGSGTSINHMSTARWKSIAQGDSIGFNFWTVHDFVPTMYTFEVPSPKHVVDGVPVGTLCINKMTEVMQARAEAYREVPKLVTDLSVGRLGAFRQLPHAFMTNSHTTRTTPLFARNDAELKYAVSRALNHGVFNRERFQRAPLKYRATVSMLIMLGYSMGYRRIVLCGIDLNDSAYFYENGKYPIMNGFRSSLATPTHATLIRKPNLMPIDRIIVHLNNQVLRPNRVELYVEHAQSALYPDLPVFPKSE